MNKSRILVAVSSPWASEKLMAPMVDLARRLDADAVIAHVARQQVEDEHESDARQRGEQTLRMLTDAMRDAGVTAEGVMLFSDDVPKAILNTAKARNCTLIVLGLTGKGTLKRLFAGDIPSSILHNVDIPVMLCPLNWSGTV